MNEENKTKHQSNPFSTGGGGVNFETRVQSVFTLLMMTKKFSPCLPHYPISRIKLQGKYDGFDTDDCIVFAEDKEKNKEAKLLIQIKHKISITENDKTFEEVIQAAWNDFKNEEIFDKKNDSIALVTAMLTATDINNVRTILDWAKCTENEDEFIKKINSDRFSSEEKRKKLMAFRVNLNKANSVEITDKELWVFLRKFNLLAYDLDSESSAFFTMAKSLICQCTGEPEDGTWEKIVSFVQNYNQNAGTINIENIPKELLEKFKINSNNNKKVLNDIKKIKEHSDYILGGIKSNIGGVKVYRQDLVNQLVENSLNSEVILLTGERGSGKSGVLKEFVNILGEQSPYIVLRAEELDKIHIQSIFMDMGVESTLDELEMQYSFHEKKYLIIESLEKLLELTNKSAFIDMLKFVQKQKNWTIIASIREYACNQIIFNNLRSLDMIYNIIKVENFNDEELSYIIKKISKLNSLIENQKIKELICNPFYLDLAYRSLIIDDSINFKEGEDEFEKVIWNTIIEKNMERSNGLPIKRRETFIKIALKRAKDMVYGVPCQDFDAEVIMKLEEDNLIRRDNTTGFISLSHDVLEDWALEHYIEKIYAQYGYNIEEFINNVGLEPAMNRAYRLWLNKKQKSDPTIAEFIKLVLISDNIDLCWRDETIASILSGDSIELFLESIEDILFEDDNNLFKQICLILRLSCKIPDYKLKEALEKEQDEIYRSCLIILKPYGKSWDIIIKYIYKNLNNLDDSMFLDILNLINDWAMGINIDETLPAVSREAGLIAFDLLERMKDSRSNKGYNRKIFEIIVRVIPSVKLEFTNFIEELINNKEAQLSYIDEFKKYIVYRPDCAFISKNTPELLIKLAYNMWIKQEENREKILFYRELNLEDHFGLNNFESNYKFFPPSGNREPFYSMFRFNYKKAIDFVIELCNTTAETYINSELGFEHKCVSVELNDGSTSKQYCSERLWCGYRQVGPPLPYIISSALMALENFIIMYVETFKDDQCTIEFVFNYIIQKSNSVMTTAVLTSVATGYYTYIGKAALPIIKTIEFYDLDRKRCIHEEFRSGLNFNGFKMGILEKVYLKEREVSAQRAWRKEHLEHLCTKLQFTKEKGAVIGAIDSIKANYQLNEEQEFMINKMDLRNFKHEYDKEKESVIFSSNCEIPEGLREARENIKNKLEFDRRFNKLYLWSGKKLDGESTEIFDESNWRYILDEVKYLRDICIASKSDNVNSINRQGTLLKTIIALLKYYATEMTKQEIFWCKEIILNEINSSLNINSNQQINISIEVSGVIDAIEILPLLLCYSDEKDEKTIKKIIIDSLTSRNISIGRRCAKGIKKYLYEVNSKFYKKCILSIIEFAIEKKKFNEKYGTKKIIINDYNKNYEKWILKIRKKMYSEKIDICIDNVDLEACSVEPLFLAFIMCDIELLDEYIDFIKNLFTYLFKIECEYDDTIGSYNDIVNEYSRTKYDISVELANFVSQLNEKNVKEFDCILNLGCQLDPSFITNFLVNLDYLCDANNKKHIYWRVWRCVSKTVSDIAINIFDYNGYQYREYLYLINQMIYTNHKWQKGDYNGKPLEGGEKYILDFARDGIANSNVFEGLCSLMYNFPDDFFKKGILIVGELEESAISKHLHRSINSIFYLEKTLNRYILIDSSNIIEKQIYYACLKILNKLIRRASSEAYYIRENLIKSKKIR